MYFFDDPRFLSHRKCISVYIIDASFRFVSIGAEIIERNTFLFQESRLEFGIGREIRVSDEIVNELKITLFFARRYLGNRKSYRDKSKSVLKGKVPRF